MPVLRPSLLLLVAASTAAACSALEPLPPPRTPLAVAPAAPREGGPPVDRSTAALIDALRSPDFAERNRAAERLVALGDAALPALGEAGDVTVLAHGRIPVSTTRPVVAAILHDEPDDRLSRAHLADRAPLVRAAAAEELGRRGARACEPFLRARLADSDGGVRAAALAALADLDRAPAQSAAPPPAVTTAAAPRGRAESGMLAGDGRR